jgi:hypothetical protein
LTEGELATQSQIRRKSQILSNLIETRQDILAEASRFSEAQHDQAFIGIWSIKDLFAHLIGWDKTNLAATKAVLKGNLPSFYAYRDPDWKTYNAMLVKKHKKGSLEQLVATAQASQKKLVDFLESIPPEQFNKDFGVRFRGYRVTIQRLLEAELEDEQTHLQQVSDFIDESK